MGRHLYYWFVIALTVLMLTCVAFAVEIKIGQAHVLHGLKIEAVYEEPVTLEPLQGTGLARDQADIHLEAEIHNLGKGFRYLFGAGAWVPYLTISFRWTKLGSGETDEGTLRPMVGPEGPHYGTNVKLAGTGKYRLTYRVEPPSLPRHTPALEEVPTWFEPFEVSWEFTFGGDRQGTEVR